MLAAKREVYAMPATTREIGLATIALVVVTIALYISMIAP
jgi:hypothetical protein